MAEKKLSDEEILRMIEEFKNTPDSEKNLLNKGMWKDVYELPNSDYVLKRPSSSLGGKNEDLIKDYIASKQIGKHIPVEQPILVKTDKELFELQKKLKTNTATNKDVNKFKKLLGVAGFELDSGDVNPNNIGKDDLGNLKALDVDIEPYSFNPTLKNKLETARKTIIEKISKSKTPRIYRSIPLIGPAIGAGLAAMSGEANAASGLPILGEADSLGPQQGSEDYEIENPQRNPAARRAALEKLSR